ncbi:LOW QUALITY PROTEIN: cytochrome c biogenesis CcmF N-terminal-like mitochondrial protein 2 [Miscanthus floridulus]|uniref:LOW QUALITY PROTEIN: cytochrome c biogenesis CcmF N-terminal-like mitochondrial protein 2 n=1 Tax=Miscanthus floridulus TaxID=154761 RepID=UPI0034590430
MERKTPLLRLFVGPPARTQWSGWLVVSGSRRNASFMPRVLATALIHSVILPLLHYWTSLLNILTLPCCVSGTFSIRSGLLVLFDWFGAREKYCLLVDKPWLITQNSPSELGN